MFGDQGATLTSQTSPDNYIIQAKPNIIFAKAGIQPREASTLRQWWLPESAAVGSK